MIPQVKDKHIIKICAIIILEFDTWYAESFLSTADNEPQTSLNAVLGESGQPMV